MPCLSIGAVAQLQASCVKGPGPGNAECCSLVIQVTMQNGNEVTILVATSLGHLSKVVLLIPQHSGATPSDVQVCLVLSPHGFLALCSST